MKGLSKKIIAIIACALLVGVIAALPGFAETQEQLKGVFVTRAEVGKWVKYASEKMEWAESMANWKVWHECSVEMSKRDMRYQHASIPASAVVPSFKPYNEADYTWP